MRTPTAPSWSPATTERRARRTRALCAALGVWTAALGCGGPGGWRSLNPVEAVAPSYDADDARELGWTFDHELAKKVAFIDDPVVAEFVFELGQAIVRQTGTQPFVYRFRVIEDDSLNAFAVFGGYVYLHSGTLAAAGSVDEVAGVLGHEVAHVRQRHHARMAEKTQLPDLLAGLAGLAAVAGAAATGEPGMVVAGQGVQAVNEAIKLRFSRAFEAEADHFGALYMNAAGYDANGLVAFFQRLIDAEHRSPVRIPPYLYSHPEVEDRIDAVEIQASSLPRPPAPQPDLHEAFRDAQAHLAALEAGHRATWIDPRRAEVPGAAAALGRAAALEEAGDREGALAALRVPGEPADPRLSFRAGVLLQELGRHREAVRAFERTIALDPTRALVFFRLGESRKALGDPPRAVFAYEQAAARAGAGSTLRRRAEWEVEKLSFPVVRDVAFARDASPGVRELRWSAALGPHFASYADRLRVRFVPPAGADARESPVERDGSVVSARLPLDAPGAVAGTWRAETLFDGDVVDVHAAELSGSRSAERGPGRLGAREGIRRAAFAALRALSPPVRLRSPPARCAPSACTQASRRLRATAAQLPEGSSWR